jgi:osmoprotectant transport system permease protein
MPDALFFNDLLRAFIEHVNLTMTALLLAIVPAFLLSLFIARRPALAEIVMTGFSLLYTVPSLAMLAMMVIVFGLGQASAITALVLYAQFILIRHFVLGLQSIDAPTLEAARGLGFSAWQKLLWVEAPLAMPVWLSGIRLAALSIVSIAVTAAWINAGGLGTLIFEGLSQNNPQKILWGAMLIVVLSCWLQTSLEGFESWALARAEGIDS